MDGLAGVRVVRIAAGEDHDPTIDRAIEALEIVLKDVPGLIEAQLLLAKTKYITNDLDEAYSERQQRYVDMMARIQLYIGIIFTD